MKRLHYLAIMILHFGLIQAQAPKYFYGMASWYGEELAGKKTASGQVFDPNALTAAHKTLPFGTLVEVESLENGNKVQVLINDRGPVTGSRVIDVSKKAAEQLGHIESGTFYVRVTIISEGTGVLTNGSAESDTGMTDETASLLPEDTETNQGYQDTIIEREVSEQVIDLDMKDDPELDKEFIKDEPEDDRNPVNDLDKPVVVVDDKNIVDLDDIPGTQDNSRTVTNTAEKNTKVVQPDNRMIVDKTLVTPDILLTNDTVIKVEKKEIDRELDIEIETPLEDYQVEKDPVKKDTVQKKQVQTEDDWQPKQDTQYEADAQGYSYAVQVGAFKKEANALKLYDQLLKKNLPVFTTEVYVKGVRFIRVRIGYFGSLRRAEEIQRQVQSMNLPGIIIKIRLAEEFR